MKIQKNFSLLKYNTFGIDVNAKYFVEINSVEDFFELMENQIFENEKKFILGGGANILLTKDFDGLVIKNNILGKEIIKEDEKNVQIKVGGGEDWSDFVDWCVDKNYAGIENLALIPGSVGAAPIQNIGAYGMEVKDIIVNVEGINLDNKSLEKLNNSECKFSYRDSIFKNKLKDKFLITHVVFELKKVDIHYKFNLDYRDITKKINEDMINIRELSVKKLANIIKEIRKNKLPDPKKIGTAGSFFKNPIVSKDEFEKLKVKYDNLIGFDYEGKIKLSAGQLIELAKFKGMKLGNVGTYEKHALVIINQGGSAQEVFGFVSMVQEKVREMFGVELEPEVNYV